MTKAKYIRVYGKVQGVFFRASTENKAHEYGLKGWVKNEMDGSVSIHIEGDDDALAKMISWCQEGPPNAHVSDLHEEEVEKKGFKLFEILD